MNVTQSIWKKETGWVADLQRIPADTAQLVLLFGDTLVLSDASLLYQIRTRFPTALIVGCSTAGEICGTEVCTDSLVLTAVSFASTRVGGAMIRLGEAEDSEQAGTRLAQGLEKDGLVHVLVLSDGLRVNGTDLVRGLVRHLPPQVSVTGGLAGDSDRFKNTCVVWNGEVVNGAIAAVGFYGDSLEIGYGSLGGWDPFGPERLITRSRGNVLYELDGQSALELYRKYLGEHASGLPATGLLFPLSLRTDVDDTPVVRTILAINEEEQSMTFAGDMPEGTYARLMKANFDRLIDGAVGAAERSVKPLGSDPDLALLISCVGRRMILKQRTEEEVEGVRDVVGKKAVLTGFYSYGELSPFAPGEPCALHNQTMTVTTFAER